VPYEYRRNGKPARLQFLSNIIHQGERGSRKTTEEMEKVFNIIRSLKYFYDHTWYFKQSLHWHILHLNPEEIIK
jgi:hypothetical protein